MAGYSRHAEADQAAAVQIVNDLARIVGEVAADHAGRVFNSAGDGFMLEFPAATAALEAAADLAARTPAPVRMGLHLGEAHLTPGGDLLGHGVNVAARLQALAVPGAILVSDDLRRAARGPIADRLRAQGRFRLDKMRETVRVHALALSPGAPRRAVRRAPHRLWWAAAGAVALALVVLAGVGLQSWQARSAAAAPLTTAVRDFVVRGGGVDPQFGVAAADRVAAALGERQAQTISRDRVRHGDTAGARLLVGGEASRDGGTLRVHVHIDDARAGVVVWAADFERPADQGDALQDAAATKVGDLVSLVAADTARLHGRLDADSLSALLRAEDISRLSPGESADEKRAAWRRVIALAPQFAGGHAALAHFDLCDICAAIPPRQLLSARQAEARAEIKTALALDPHEGAAFVAGSLLPDRSDLLGQEAWLTRGLLVDPGNAALNVTEADLSAKAGRLSDAVRLARKGLEADPLARTKTESLVFALIISGQITEAGARNDRVRRVWPDYGTGQLAQLTLDLIYGSPAQAEAALAAAERGELPMTRQTLAAWRQVLDARAGRIPKAPAAQALVRAATQDRGLDLGLEVIGLAVLGQTDMAFAELDRRIPQGDGFYFSTLYQPAAAALRASPRFMPFAARMGLARYWLASGRWPDFCADPALPYRCPAAAKAAIEAAPRT